MSDSAMTLDRAKSLAKQSNVIPVFRCIPQNDLTPVDLFERMGKSFKGNFLLESAEHGIWSRYSIIGVNHRGTLSKDSEGRVLWHSDDAHSLLPDAAPLSTDSFLAALEQAVNAWHSPVHGDLPPLTSGLVGTLSWDMIREIEKLPNRNPKPYQYPEAFFAMINDAIVFDHQEGQLWLVANIYLSDNADIELEYLSAQKRLERLETLTQEPLLAKVSERRAEVGLVRSNMSKDQFFEMVANAKHFVEIGDVFQVVLSQRFDLDTNSTPLEIYRELRQLNPSPYMYLLDFEQTAVGFSVVGSSPEALVKVSEGRAVMHPIAGSRPRGMTDLEDSALAEELSADRKEQAEHLMLVDLARNDLLKVCIPSTVTVSEFMEIHKFSHIQHLVSTVEGTVQQDKTAIDVFRATFPAGTLSGAPKPRALEIIEELEADNRGLYGGVVGYFDFAGNSDLAIAIRTAVLRDGIAHVQAGAGIVLDSVAESEFEETRSKASAVLRAAHQAGI